VFNKLSLNNIRLRNKMLILYVLSALIPIVLTNVIFYQVTTDNVKKQRMQDISRALEQIKNEFRAEIDDAVSVSTIFFNDYNLNEIIETEYAKPADYVMAYDSYFRRILNSYTPVYTSVQNIKIYVDNPTLLHSGGIGYISEEVKRSEWYQAARETSVAFLRTPMEDTYDLTEDDGNTREAFSIVRRMNNFDDVDSWEKILKIELKLSSIDQLFNNLNLNGYVYLVNASGTIEYTTNREVDWRREIVDYASVPLPDDAIVIEKAYESVSYLDGWRVIGTISEEEVFLEVQQSREFVIWLAFLNILASTIVIVWITRSLNVRLVNILRHMKRVKNQQFDTIKTEETLDEIGQLTSEFNRMTLQIKSLIDDVYVADIQKKNLEIERRRAQLNALQSQINPHFLFNALETIRMRSLIKQETETAKIIHNMAKIFRSSLTWNRDKITVDEEMAFILCFLEIQKYRFGDRLEYELHIDPDVRECAIPKMVFLPFVENASIHGIEKLKSGGRIDLRIVRKNERLVFSIHDNGAGMEPEQVSQFYSYLEQDEEFGERIGVQNVIYRLKMIYGDSLELAIDSEPNRGTFIRISIPIDKLTADI
jgi:two-component system, sensor histidine kinase YesM